MQPGCYQEGDADIRVLTHQQVVVVGYGHLGRSAALNLRDAGLEVKVGSREDPSASLARSEGFAVVSIDDALSSADVIWLALPDEVIPDILSASAPVRPRRGSLVCLSSGYCLAYDLLKLPDDIDVVLLAPRMVGSQIRALYQERQGFYSFVSVEQDVTTTARARLLALAAALGTLRGGAMEVPAATEAALDLFVEQTVGPYLGAAVLAAFEVGTAQGLPPEGLALELYLSGEMAKTWQAFTDEGFFKAVRLHGHCATFGGFSRLGDIDTEAMKNRFGAILDDIVSGRFADSFQEEVSSGSPSRDLIEAMIAGDDPMSKAEAAVRAAKGS